jgi:hypothetical protein
VDRLLGVAADVDADAGFRFTRRPEPTTLRRELEQAARSLRTDCAPEQAQRLVDALR